MCQIFFLGKKAIGGCSVYDDTEIMSHINELQNYVPEYVTKSEYNVLVVYGTVDENKMYIITDLVEFKRCIKKSSSDNFTSIV